MNKRSDGSDQQVQNQKSDFAVLSFPNFKPKLGPSGLRQPPNLLETNSQIPASAFKPPLAAVDGGPALAAIKGSSGSSAPTNHWQLPNSQETEQ